MFKIGDAVRPGSFFGGTGGQRGIRSIVKRAQHSRDIAQGRKLAPSLFRGPSWLTLKIDNDEVLFCAKHLSQVEVTVNPCTYGRDLPLQKRREPPQDFRLQVEQSLDLLRCNLGQVRGPEQLEDIGRAHV